MKDDHVNQPRILLLSLSNDIGMDRLPSALVKHGARCALISPSGFYATHTRFIEHHFALPRHYGIWLGTAFAGARLAAAAQTWNPDIVIPLDDVASNLLRNLVLDLPSGDRLRALVETSLGRPAGYAAASSRGELMRVASSAGVRVPRFHIATDSSATLQTAADWGYPVVLKAEHTCGGSGVLVVPDAAAMESALAASCGLAATWQRCRRAGRDWMWNFAGVVRSRATAPVMQALIRGVPAMRTVAAWNGQVLAGVSFQAEHVHPAPTGSSTTVRHIEHPEMEAAVRRLVEVLGSSGFVSFDFMLDDTTGAAYLIEMNPRPIGTTHLGELFGHDVVAALLAQLRGMPVPEAALSNRLDRLVALFPKELERDPFALDRLRSSVILHDVPFDDPGIVAVYMQRLSHIHPDVAEIFSRRLRTAPRPPRVSLVPTSKEA
jgi:ATP-grasp domain